MYGKICNKKKKELWLWVGAKVGINANWKKKSSNLQIYVLNSMLRSQLNVTNFMVTW